MNFNSLEKFNEIKKLSSFRGGFIAVVCAVIFAFMFNAFFQLIKWFVLLIAHNWGKILIGIVALIFLKRILFRRKHKVQEMRIVR